MAAPHPIHRRFLAEDLIRLRRADEKRRYAASQRRGRIDPNPHQIDGVIFALRRIPEGGCILADEVGLGKTIEAGLVIAQLLAEGASRVLLIVPKPLVGQWRQELYELFGIEAREGGNDESFEGAGVFLVGREYAGSANGEQALMGAPPFDLCVIDEAHEVFAGIYRRFDRDGLLRDDSPKARIAYTVKGVVRDTPVLLLTATPLQNSLAELWGLVYYVEPTGTLLGDLGTFREMFCDGDDRRLIDGQDEELRRRIATVCQRTLRRQAQEFLDKPFVDRRALLIDYRMSPEERALYDDVTAYLLEPGIAAFRGNHRRLLLISFHRQMASSVKALAASLRKVAARLRRLEEGLDPDNRDLLDDLDDEEEDEGFTDEREMPEASAIAAELARVEAFVERAESLPSDSKAKALLRAVDLVNTRFENGQGSGKVVIFTESLPTQDYLRDLLVESGLDESEITLFRGTNDGPRAAEALARWKAEAGANIPEYNRPSREVAVRLALVHEFKTRSRVFISTEAGAKGLNLQFCETLVNYDLPWNPQRIEQRIGRCHRYGQREAVTVINFIDRDNDAQRLTFDILSQKLDLFGTVLDASDAVLHEPRTDTPEVLASVMAAELETRLRRIYERARSVEEVEAGLRELRESIGEERSLYEQEAARTRSLIESRFDEKVRQVFKKIQAELPVTLAALDGELDKLLCGYLDARGIGYERTEPGDGHIRFEIAASDELPEGLDGGVTVAIGHANDIGDADPVHLGHPLVQAAVDEARSASRGRLRVSFDAAGHDSLVSRRGARGRLLVTKVRYPGFERVEHLVPVAMIEDEVDPLPTAVAEQLVAATPTDVGPFDPPIDIAEEDLEDVIEEQLFVDLGKAGDSEQRRFELAIAQIERFLDDKTLVMGRRRTKLLEQLRTAEQRRDGAIGAQARTQAEQRVMRLQEQVEALETEIARLRRREDDDYETWRKRTHERFYAKPEVERILDVEFVLS